MSSEYTLSKGDLLLESKHADAAFSDYDGWALFFYDTPKKGKTLSVEYNRGNWPAVLIVIQANWKAKRQIARYRRDGWTEGTF